MFQKIMVPIDGSDRSEAAIALAIAVAKDRSAKILFGHVYEAIHYTSMEGMMPVEQITDEEARAAAQLLLDRAVQLAVADGIEASGIVVEGETTSALLDVAHTHDIDLIVMATHGRSGIARAVLGSKTEQLIRKADIPVLIAAQAPSAKSP